jgi:low affinity Fe/Cu permease
MRLVIAAAMLSLLGANVAQASCADDAKDMHARIDEKVKLHPTPQLLAAKKQLDKVDESLKQHAELDCYNALERSRRALNARPAENAQNKNNK